MPYYVHAKGEEPTEGREHDSRKEAQGDKCKGETVTFVPNSREKYRWRVRERRRFETGDYSYVPWNDPNTLMPDWYDQYHNLHFAHMSVSAPGLIAYTPDEEYGCQDRQIRVRPGRYLHQFAPNLSQAEVDDLCAKIKARCDNWHPKITSDADEIVRVYMNGPASCMSGTMFQFAEHPTRVYGGCDLAVAYLGDPETHVTARCVVWPDRKVFTRVYGDTTLAYLLKQDGYENGSLDGAKVRAIDTHHGYLMPYVDAADTCDGPRRGYFTLRDDNRGEYGCKTTGGYLEETERFYCQHCETEIPEDQTYCDDCAENSFSCRGCYDRIFDETSTTIDGREYCDTCAAARRHECAVCGDTFYSNRDRDLCDDCEEEYRKCGSCGDYYDIDAERCEHCAKAARRDRTGDQLSTG